MKKIISLIFVIALLLLSVFVLTGCENNDNTQAKKYPLKVNVEGSGEVAYAIEFEDLVFDDENKKQSIVTNIAAGDKVNISAQASDGWRFVKWKKDGVDYSTDAWIVVTVTGEVEYVAVFEPAVTITFDYNYGNDSIAQMSRAIEPGSTVQEFEETREGYTLDGWYIDKECTKKFDFSTPITEDIRIYAKWIKK